MWSQDREAAHWKLGNGQGLVHILVQCCAGLCWMSEVCPCGAWMWLSPQDSHVGVLVLWVAMMGSSGPLGGGASGRSLRVLPLEGLRLGTLR